MTKGIELNLVKTFGDFFENPRMAKGGAKGRRNDAVRRTLAALLIDKLPLMRARIRR